MFKMVILYVPFFFLFVNKGWDSSLLSGCPSTFCISTNKNCFRMYVALFVCPQLSNFVSPDALKLTKPLKLT